ncbi:hypothetical protein BDZ45DRAFT_310826 [Acephala macrosclerotiorum]|nr:hypothetical protein BDZ45DRAFT_310826 [Acephala macrosclerotiorum]
MISYLSMVWLTLAFFNNFFDDTSTFHTSSFRSGPGREREKTPASHTGDIDGVLGLGTGWHHTRRYYIARIHERWLLE